MKLRSPRFVVISLASAALWGVLGSVPAGAADSACKGLEEAQCTAADGCSWTKEYTRKDGKTVAGHCKSVGKKAAGAAAEKAAPPPAAKAAGTAPAAAPDAGATGMAPYGTATGKPPVGTGAAAAPK